MNPEALCQQRSLKYFQGLARGCWLVSWDWVQASAAAGRWLPEEGHEVKGDHVALGAPTAGAYLQHNIWQVQAILLHSLLLDKENGDILDGQASGWESKIRGMPSTCGL